MKRKVLAFALSCLLCLGLAVPAFAAVEELVDLRLDDVVAYSPEEGIYTVVREGRYGFYRADGTQLLAPEYSAVGEFSGGLAAVSPTGEWVPQRAAGGGTINVLLGGRFGYVDANGSLLVPMRYSRAFPYVDGRAFAVRGDTGVLVLLDELGREIASFPEAEVMENETVRFSESLAILPVRRALAEEEGFPAATEEAESADGAGEPEAAAELPLSFLVIDRAGREVCVLTDDCVDFAGGYHCGRVAAAVGGEWTENGRTRCFTSGVWGYRDERGELAVDFQYAGAEAFSADRLAVVGVQSESESVLWGFVDPEGMAVVPAQYEAVRGYADGIGAVRRSGGWAYVNAGGRLLTGFIYDEAGDFHEGLALALRREKLCAVDRTGRTVFSVEAVSGEPFNGGITALRQADGLYGIYDAQGNELVPFSYENAYHWDGYLWLKRGDLWRVYETAEVIAARQSAPEGESVEVGAFADVSPNAWYAEAVTWATDHDVITGTGGGQFSPDKPCTVGEILTFLWRAMGRPESEMENPFVDVTANHYYYQAALWAYEMGLVEGNTFGAAELCSRGTAVTYLWKLDGAPWGALNYFVDVPWDAPYAQAVAWAVDRGVTAGRGGVRFAPQEICSRGQIVTFLHRYLAQS